MLFDPEHYNTLRGVSKNYIIYMQGVLKALEYLKMFLMVESI